MSCNPKIWKKSIEKKSSTSDQLRRMEEYQFDHLSTPSHHGSNRGGRLLSTQKSNNNGTITTPFRSSLSTLHGGGSGGGIAGGDLQNSPGFSTAGKGSLHSSSLLNTSTYTINGGGGGGSSEGERNRLEKQVYDLKMRIHSLDEQLSRYQEREIIQQRTANETSAILSDLKLQLEEKTIELEERNLLLMKAKNAMEILKKELFTQQVNSQKQKELEEKLLTLKRMNEEIERENKNQLALLEQENKSLKQLLNQKDQQFSLAEDQIVSRLPAHPFLHPLSSSSPLFYFLETARD